MRGYLNHRWDSAGLEMVEGRENPLGGLDEPRYVSGKNAGRPVTWNGRPLRRGEWHRDRDEAIAVVAKEIARKRSRLLKAMERLQGQENRFYESVRELDSAAAA